MQVDAHVLYWTKGGMSSRAPSVLSVPYVTVQEAEQLMEEAHERGRQRGITEAHEMIDRARLLERG